MEKRRTYFSTGAIPRNDNDNNHADDKIQMRDDVTEVLQGRDPTPPMNG